MLVTLCGYDSGVSVVVAGLWIWSAHSVNLNNLIGMIPLCVESGCPSEWALFDAFAAADEVHVEHASDLEAGSVSESCGCPLNSAAIWIPLKVYGSVGSCAGHVTVEWVAADAANWSCELPNANVAVSVPVEVVSGDLDYAVWACEVM